jgi:hypothetical protein
MSLYLYSPLNYEKTAQKRKGLLPFFNNNPFVLF